MLEATDQGSTTTESAGAAPAAEAAAEAPFTLPAEYLDPQGAPDIKKLWDEREGLRGQLEERDPDKLREQFEQERLGNRPEGPDKYELGDLSEVLPEGVDINLVDDSELAQWWRKLAWENGLPAESFTEGYKQFIGFLQKMDAVDTDAEMKALGENAADRIQAAKAFVEAQVPPDFKPIVEALGDTANGVAFLEWVRDRGMTSFGETRNGGAPNIALPNTVEECNARLAELRAKPEYATNQALQREADLLTMRRMELR